MMCLDQPMAAEQHVRHHNSVYRMGYLAAHAWIWPDVAGYHCFRHQRSCLVLQLPDDDCLAPSMYWLHMLPTYCTADCTAALGSQVAARVKALSMAFNAPH